MNFKDPNVDLITNNLLIFGVIYLIICFSIAWIWGRKRKIGFLWSFMFSVLMTPLIGLVITLSGKKKKWIIFIKNILLKELKILFG